MKEKRLLADAELALSSVVANNAMNRLRGLAGANSYTRELGFNPVDFLAGRPSAAWLDLCCGSGNALLQAAGLLPGVRIIGVDLVGYFTPPPHHGVEFVEASVTEWEPPYAFDLITCVHGLHYVGDKLGVLAKVASWLTEDGRFAADLDLASIRRADGSPAGRRLVAALRAEGFGYDGRRRRVGLSGRKQVRSPYTYLGADAEAGPNYTGQPAVMSYYRD
ncbi:Methyltransferase domain-containing protein [Amycolatopsis xylanica]|uniref:Methyltransferase domain-containing protein n=1 Tax=Amycolatopsis xylanica TaxID=589385 RepID=A0A1H3DWZ9_9PSEU|nr:class I SAM-dependent methyltransferase [Amycolatopsis xylanica]SDX70857.1 Methyltransferase domain-containing protein [Amycolatopsis xylanica]